MLNIPIDCLSESLYACVCNAVTSVHVMPYNRLIGPAWLSLQLYNAIVTWCRVYTGISAMSCYVTSQCIQTSEQDSPHPHKATPSSFIRIGNACNNPGGYTPEAPLKIGTRVTAVYLCIKLHWSPNKCMSYCAHKNTHPFISIPFFIEAIELFLLEFEKGRSPPENFKMTLVVY